MYSIISRSIGLAAVIAVSICSSNVKAQEVQAFYNFDTGNVQVEIVSDIISLFTILSRDGTLNEAGTDFADGTGFIDFAEVNTTNGLGDPETADQDQVNYATAADAPFAPGTYDIGDLFDAQLTLVDDATGNRSNVTDSSGNSLGIVALAFTVNGENGDQGVSRQVPLSTVSAIPEPTTLPLLAVASGLFLKRRRRA